MSMPRPYSEQQGGPARPTNSEPPLEDTQNLKRPGAPNRAPSSQSEHVLPLSEPGPALLDFRNLCPEKAAQSATGCIPNLLLRAQIMDILCISSEQPKAWSPPPGGGPEKGMLWRPV
ncbi:hypothetical protein GW7_12005 [Heterocephalus glaber]|uniref:Uncharacterized protein n=1 Tax=Heterocephalus glaber TaxID=10181 RepID=G5AUF1_HETGA|nr:hypothetical protein GW7_12005 [Heterocephalus glaber]